MKYEQLLLPGFEEEPRESEKPGKPQKPEKHEMWFECVKCHREFGLVLEDGFVPGFNPRCAHCGSPKTMRF